MRSKKPGPKNPVGRPKDLSLGESFSIRLTLQEEAWFRERAEELAMGMSVYIRMVLTEHARREMAKGELGRGTTMAKERPPTRR